MPAYGGEAVEQRSAQQSTPTQAVTPDLEATSELEATPELVEAEIPSQDGESALLQGNDTTPPEISGGESALLQADDTTPPEISGGESALLQADDTTPPETSGDESALSQADEPASGEEQKFYLHADILTRDEEAGITRAVGNVEVAYGADVLSADQITLYEAENRIVAEGNVRILDKEGTTTYGDNAVLRDDGKRIDLTNPRIVLPEGSRIAARTLEKRSDTQYVLHRGVFTPCAPCEDKTKNPLWQIRASKVMNDRQGKNLHYYNAVFEVLGIPVFYTPYHSHPDPTVKRRSGWLRPGIGHANHLGDIYDFQYFGVISPHANFTFAPRYTNQEGWILKANTNIRTKRGFVYLEGGGVNSQSPRTNKEQIRKYARLNGRFDIDKNWRWGGEYSKASDSTLLRRYGISAARVTQSNLYLEGFTPRNYARAEIRSYQDFRETATTPPRLYPALSYNLVTPPTHKFGNWDMNFNLINFKSKREAGQTSMTRLVNEATKNYAKATSWGGLFEYTTQLRANFYDTTEYFNKTITVADKSADADAKDTKKQTILGKEDNFASQLTARFGATGSYPLAAVQNWGYWSVTPKVGSSVGPNFKRKESIPNLDSGQVEFDESDLFIVDRATGFDRTENGKRVDYGSDIAAYLKDGKGFRGFLGQSYRIDEDPLFPELSGGGKGFSDYVGNFTIFPASDFAFDYRFRLDRKDTDLRVSEARTNFSARNEEGLGISTSLSYLKVKLPYQFSADEQRVKRREAVSHSTSFRVHENWSGALGGSYNIDTNQSVGYTATFGYDDECLVAKLYFKRVYVKDRDYSTMDTIYLQVSFKYVGPLIIK